MIDYWDGREIYFTNIINQVINRKKFQDIHYTFHLADNSKNPTCKMSKVGGVLNVIEKFSKFYSPSDKIVIDEGVVPFRGRLNIKQYMPYKPHKWGIKAYIIADSINCYNLNTIFYSGKDTFTDEKSKYIGYNVVDKMMEPYYFQNYKLFIDSFYTSYQLVKDMANNGVGVTGTFFPNRKGFPDAPDNKKHDFCLKKHQCATYRDGEILCCYWMDSVQVCVVSNVYGNSSNTKKIKWNDKTFVKPNMIDMYTKYMRGVDGHNQLVAYHRFTHRSVKWWRAIFYHVLQMTIVNSLIIYNNFGKSKKRISKKKFILEIVESYLKLKAYKNNLGDFLMQQSMSKNLLSHNISIEIRDLYYSAPEGNNNCQSCKIFIKIIINTHYKCKFCHLNICRRCQYEHTMNYHISSNPKIFPQVKPRRSRKILDDVSKQNAPIKSDTDNIVPENDLTLIPNKNNLVSELNPDKKIAENALTIIPNKNKLFTISKHEVKFTNSEIKFPDKIDSSLKTFPIFNNHAQNKIFYIHKWLGAVDSAYSSMNKIYQSKIFKMHNSTRTVCTSVNNFNRPNKNKIFSITKLPKFNSEAIIIDNSEEIFVDISDELTDTIDRYSILNSRTEIINKNKFLKDQFNNLQETIIDSYEDIIVDISNQDVDVINSNSIKDLRNIKIKNQKIWTAEEDMRLIDIAGKYNEKHWKEVSTYFSNKSSLQCFSRYKRIRPGIIKSKWTQEEDLIIMQSVDIYGKSWSKISKVLGRHRHGKQIRDRYLNILDPEINKEPFSIYEDKKIVELYKYNGAKWAAIAKNLPGRTGDMIKNRFYSSIQKDLLSNNDREGNVSKIDKKSDLIRHDLHNKNVSKKKCLSDNQALVSIINPSENDYMINTKFNYNHSNNFKILEQYICDQIDKRKINNFNHEFSNKYIKEELKFKEMFSNKSTYILNQTKDSKIVSKSKFRKVKSQKYEEIKL